MSNLFSRNDYKNFVDEETREWIEEYFLWLINSFGKENIKNRKVLTPDFRDFPIRFNEQQSAVNILKIVAKQMEINLDDVILDFYKEGQNEIDTGSPLGHRVFLQNVSNQKYSGGVYLGQQENGKYIIGIEEKKLKDLSAIVATMAHELSHIKLLGEKRIEVNNEYLTDLTTIVFGLGIFNANNAFKTFSGINSWGWSRSGYLSQQQWGYALALYAHLKEEENPKWIKFLSANIKGTFKRNMDYIKNNPEKIYNKKYRIEEPNSNDVENRKIYEARKNKDFDELISLYKEKLAVNPENKIILNALGYFLLQQKKYKDAIVYFDKAITFAPKYDFPYNNRGYCKLQLEDTKGAFEDIHKACEMNPFNSFTWRNLGAYYLKINEFEKALDNFEEAEKIDYKTELINFYLGTTHERLGNKERAQEYLNKSIELNEYNDSLIE